MSELSVAVVGAGIAGLTFAATYGEACSLYEKAPAAPSIGCGLQIAPNAARVLHSLGLAEELGRRATKLQAREFRRWDTGATIACTQLGASCERLFGTPYYGVRRSDLHHMLLRRAPAVRTGQAVTSVADQGEKVRIDFSTGHPSIEHDIVIGADGIGSVVRNSVRPDNTVFSGQVIYRGLIPRDRVRHLFDEPKAVIWVGPARHFVCYPVGEFVSFSASVPADDSWEQESWTAPGSVNALAEAYIGWSRDLHAVIGAADHVSRWALVDREPVDEWNSGRITLIGDAAHPMLPYAAQGANQAIEDAAALAAALRGRGAQQVPSALHRLMRVRSERVGKIQRVSRELGMTLHLPDGPEQIARDTAMATSSLTELTWLWGYEPDKAITA
ncbi:FAD-dependent monooxygenase [Streptomyces monashensis]|uniref:FAD-binding domain-containing protein n=1 Tax=Streptomyces monashensis TaxID=1678012 RepID=A0A1S2PR81_9ACTN|nr:FAD-dependent monooxygenase [Streptomyces monashensis]OIJ96321.1 hypothetical protein BIV23_32730 [Streptomyces monashensis]